MKTDFIALDYDSVNIGNKTYIKIFGRDSKGKSVCLIDEAINFFYVFSKNPDKLLSKIKKISLVENAEVVDKNFLGKPVKAIKVFCEYKNIKDIVEELKDINDEIETRERDINLITRYIIERDLKSLVWQEVEGDVLSDSDLNGLVSSLNVDLVLNFLKYYYLNDYMIL